MDYSFKEYLNEVAIQFGRKAYPKFGQVVILMGGAGSGKGFVKDKLLSIEGKTFDVDEMKRLAISSKIFAAKVKSETGLDLKKLDLRKPADVSTVHDIIGDLYKVDKKLITTTIRSVLMAHPDRKPNLIYDVTLKDISKLKKVSDAVTGAGYKKENIHIVWVMNKFDVAVEQNKGRSRIVPSEIMFATHEGAALSFLKILEMGKSIQKYMNGDIFIAFNQQNVDSDLAKSSGGGSYIKKANYVHAKIKGKPQKSIKELGNDVIDVIRSYVPKTVTWG
jgi:hypothetical protein